MNRYVLPPEKRYLLNEWKNLDITIQRIESGIALGNITELRRQRDLIIQRISDAVENVDVSPLLRKKVQKLVNKALKRHGIRPDVRYYPIPPDIGLHPEKRKLVRLFRHFLALKLEQMKTAGVGA